MSDVRTKYLSLALSNEVDEPLRTYTHVAGVFTLFAALNINYIPQFKAELLLRDNGNSCTLTPLDVMCLQLNLHNNFYFTVNHTVA